MSKNRYLTISTSEIREGTGDFYPDLMSFPIEQFEFRDVQEVYTITKADLARFDILMLKKYGYCNYDDLVLFLNNVGHLQLLEPGDTLKLPSKRDLDNFIKTYMSEV